jgi:hypothetical protein
VYGTSEFGKRQGPEDLDWDLLATTLAQRERSQRARVPYLPYGALTASIVLTDPNWYDDEGDKDLWVSKVVSYVKDPEPERPERSSRLLWMDVALKGQSSFKSAHVDPGSELDIISVQTATEWGLKVQPLPGALAKFCTGEDFPLRGMAKAHVILKDSFGTLKQDEILFAVADIVSSPILLGMPWCEVWNPQPDFVKKTLSFVEGQGREYRLVAAVSPDSFASAILDGSSQLYICTVASLSYVETASGKVPQPYQRFAKRFGEEQARELPVHSLDDLAIEIMEGKQPPFGPLYNLSGPELEALRHYLHEYQSRGWIRHSRSPAGAPILFVKKPNGTLRLCVDYRGLNAITIKNRHPLPLIPESLERLSKAKVFTTFDLKEAYHQIRIKKGHEWKTAFRTRYGHFEYTVMPFGLTNAPAQFQAKINRALAGLVDVICIVYLDDILIYSEDPSQHEADVCKVLERLEEHDLYINLAKSTFSTTETEFLGYYITPKGVTIHPDRIKTILKWPLPKNVHEVRVFIGFVNYYRRFIEDFGRLAAPLNELTKKSKDQAKSGPKLRREELTPLKLTSVQIGCFRALLEAFRLRPVLAHYDPALSTRIETDASGRAICGILSQFVIGLDGKETWKPVAFMSRKMTDVETRYDTHDTELLAILESLKEWRHLLEGLRDEFEVLTDHNNLKWFMTTKALSRRQAGWAEWIARFHFWIAHRPGKNNPADAPSRRPDYMEGAQEEVRHAASRGLSYLQHQLSKTTPSVPREPWVAAVTRSQTKSGAERTDPATNEPASDLSVSDAASVEVELSSAQNGATEMPRIPNLTTPPRRFVDSEEERRRILLDCHKDPLSGHFGRRKTLEKVRRHYTWPRLHADIKEMIDACLACNQAKASRHKPYGLLQPLPVPQRAWQHITMDYITDLPPCRIGNEEYDSIVVFVDRFSKMAHYAPIRKDIKAKDLARIFRREIIRLHGPPESIVFDRGPPHKSKFFETFLHFLSTKGKFTTAYHPQGDGQTERQNQTLEAYLRIYCSTEQDDWAHWLDTAEFAYNDTVHDATKMTPFQCVYGQHPRGLLKPEDDRIGDVPIAADIVRRMFAIQREVRENLLHIQKGYAKWANRKRKDIEFRLGQQVMLKAKNLKSPRLARKLDRKNWGPFEIIEVPSKLTVKLKLPQDLRIHDVFHVSLLEPYRASDRFPQEDPPLWDKLDLNAPDVYNVEKILEQKWDEEKSCWMYLCRWAGYDSSDDTWEPATNLGSRVLNRFTNTRRVRRKRKVDDSTQPTIDIEVLPRKSSRGRLLKRREIGD